MRWPTTCNAIILAPKPEPKVFVRPWVNDAYIESVCVASLTLTHSDDAEFAAQMRGVLLDHAERLVEILRGDERPLGELLQ